MTSINAIAATEHRNDLLRAARQGRVSRVDDTPAQSGSEHRPTIALRVADPDEVYRVARLAALDDAPPLQGDVLLALSDGEAIAALSLKDGRVVANPFVSTEDAVALLHVREKHLLGARRHRRWRAILRPRFA